MEAKGNGGMSGMTKNMDRTIERASDRAHQAVDRAAGAASSMAERVDAMAERADELRELPETWVEGARDYVRENPLASLGIALAAGYVLSLILRSR